MMDELPPLPEPDLHDGVILRNGGKYAGTEDGYTAAKLRAYAAAAVAKERERCAAICEREICPCCFDESATAAAEYLAECIRATQATPPPPAAS